MALAAFIKSLEDAEEQFRSLYVEATDGVGFVLDVDDSAYKNRLGEFRGNNIKLAKQVETLQADLGRFKDVDPDRYQQAVTQLAEIKEKQLLDTGQLDEVVAQRTETMRRDLEAQLAARDEAAANITAERDQFRGMYQDLEVTHSVLKAFDEVANVRKGALPDVMARAKSTWRINDENQLQAYSGKNPMYGSDGKPMTPMEWATGLSREAPHLFEGSIGGGAGGKTIAEPGMKPADTVRLGDRQAFSDNIADIASGKKTVVG